MHSVHAQEPESPIPSDDTAHNSILWDVSNGGGIQEHYAKLTLGLSKAVSTSLSLTSASDGAQGFSAGIIRNSEKGWLGLDYKTIEQSNDISSQSMALNGGRIVGDWAFSITPRYTRTSVYAKTGSKQSSSISAGLSAGLTHRGKDLDIGAETGVNFYSDRLDSYITDSRKIGKVGLQSQLTTTGLEQSYWSAFLSRYHSWGELGLDYLDTVTAVDLSHSQSVAASIVYYLSRQWDLRLALMQGVYSGSTQSTFTVGAKYYW